MKRTYRKPLIVQTPKGILRLAAATSSLESMAEGTCFQPVLDDPSITVSGEAAVERVVFLSGKMYYDLIKERSERSLEGRIAFIRIEEISPFPYAKLEKVLSRYSNGNNFLWAQDGPENGECFAFVLPRLSQLLPEGHNLQYVGRKACSSIAPGVSSYFNQTKTELMQELFDI